MKPSIANCTNPPEDPAAGRTGNSPSWMKRYFTSGWAFLLPYLICYLLYWWRNWPVNANSAAALGAGGWVPALLHVYWSLHLVHLAMVTAVLGRWWASAGLGRAGTESRAESRQRLAQDVLPWICLGLLFWIPGVYLEYPADTWEHLGRINRWIDFSTVTANPDRAKTTYFLAYSLVGQIEPLTRRLIGLDIYYAATCLLLGWQYYRLALACGLRKPLALAFVVFQSLLLGNSLFGLYRYYGLSSSLFAQLGAIALTRLSVEFVQPRKDFQAVGLPQISATLEAAAGMMLLACFSHVQGAGIAAVGVLGVLAWVAASRGWRRLLFAAAAFAVLNFLVYRFWPRDPLIDTFARPQGWVSAAYGFNLFAPNSPAFDRAIQILGAFGLLSLIAAVYLLRRNHIVAWLTLVPALCLACPAIAIPFINQLFEAGQTLLVYHRLLLAMPIGLAVITASNDLATRFPSVGRFAFWWLIGVLSMLVTVPAAAPYFNRTFNAFQRPPSDLVSLPPDLPATLGTSVSSKQIVEPHRLSILASDQVSFAYHAIGISTATTPTRRTEAIYPPAVLAEAFLDQWENDPDHWTVVIPNQLRLFTPYSAAGVLSGNWPRGGHWGPQHLATSFVGYLESRDLAHTLNLAAAKTADATFFPQAFAQRWVESFHEVLIGTAPGKTTAWFGFSVEPKAQSFVELAGSSVQGETGVVLESAAHPGEDVQHATLGKGRVKFWTADTDVMNLGLQAKRHGGFALSAIRVGVSFEKGSNRRPPIESATWIARDVWVACKHAPGGLIFHIPLTPGRDYVVELVGQPQGVVPSLRIAGDSHRPEFRRYLSAESPGLRFRVRTLGTLEVLLYQDVPYEFVLESLRVRPAANDDLSAVPDGFDESVTTARYKWPDDHISRGP